MSNDEPSVDPSGDRDGPVAVGQRQRSLEELRGEIARVGELAVGDRLTAFDDINAAIVDELSRLDEL